MAIKGARAMAAAFAALPDVVRDRMRAATETTVQQIARGAQARILSSPSVRTRALYNHVAWRVTTSTGRGRVGIATGIAHGYFVEFGTRHSKAEPFMLPAAEAEKHAYLDRCIRAGRDIERDMAAIGQRNL